jgi:hypothetical protein
VLTTKLTMGNETCKSAGNLVSIQRFNDHHSAAAEKYGVPTEGSSDEEFDFNASATAM